MRKAVTRIWGILLACAMLLTLCTVKAFAEPTDETQSGTKMIYVSAQAGSDDSGDGTQGTPYATLAKAVAQASAGDTIQIMTDLVLPDTIVLTKDLTMEGQDNVTLSAENGQKKLIELSSDVNVTLRNLQFDGSNQDNSQAGGLYGGAIGADSNSTEVFVQNVGLTIEGCKFTGFEAYTGGAIGFRYASNVTLTVNNTEFTDNKAQVSGGAIGFVNCKSVDSTIENSVFRGNSGKSYGGAVASDDSYDGIETFSFTGCQFENNKIVGTGKTLGGGAIGISDGEGIDRKVHLLNCNFTNNMAEGTSGGAVFVNATNVLSVEGCDFTENSSSSHGGAMHIACGSENTQVTFTGNTFDSNVAGGQGGALNLGSGGLNVTIDKALFQSNTTDIHAGNAIAFFASGNAATRSTIYSTDGAAFYDNGSAEDGIDRDTIYVQSSSGADDSLKITDYMLDGTRLNWKYLTQNEDSESVLTPADRDDYALVEGEGWNSNIELYLDADTPAPILSRDEYSNVFINNHANYGGAICNYASLTIGKPGRDVVVNKSWTTAEGTALPEEEQPQAITVNLIRQADEARIESAEITAEDGWTATFCDFPANVEFSVTEDSLFGYKNTISNSDENTVSIQNSLAGEVQVTPADITVYTGGEGYTGVVDEEGKLVTNQNNGLPEAGFYIELPQELDEQLKQELNVGKDTVLDLSKYLSFTNGSKTWTLELYDGEQTSVIDGKYIYRLVAAADQDPVRMQFIDEQKHVEISDQFDLSNTLYSKYDMEIYPGTVEQETVRAVLRVNGKEVKYPIEANTGKLTIRGVTQKGETTKVVAAVDKAVSHLTAVLPAGTTYTINDSTVQVVDGTPALLVDEIVSPDNTQSGKDFRTLLTNKAVETAAKDFRNVASEARYLDLVDAANGNTWIKADKPVTVYWPYPAGTNADTQFRLVHFVGMNREMTADEAASNIETATVETIAVKTDAYGISFTTDSFSPFVLMWDNTQTTTVTEQKPDEHPDIAEAKENGTWGQPTPTPAPAAAAVIPQTSDDMPLGLLVGLAVVAVVAIVVLVVLRRRRKH